jgi:acyl-CoA thioesterase
VTTFDADTALERASDGSFQGEIKRSWSAQRGPNGGYLAAMILRAARMTVDDATLHPRSFTLHYVAAPAPGPCTLTATVERAGKVITTLSARLTQDGQLCVLALAAFSRPRVSIEVVDVRMPEAPAPEDAMPVPPGSGGPDFWSQYEIRWAFGPLPFTGSSGMRSGGWTRLREPHVADALVIAALADAWFPQIFIPLTAPIPAPTLDLTTHFRTLLPLERAQPDDWYLLAVSSRLATEGFFEEDCDIWSRDGQLVAQARQLVLLPAAHAQADGTNG